MIARNTDRRNGTKMDSAACIPATIITTLAAASREWVPIHDLFLFIMCNTSCKVEIILLDLHALSDYKSIGCYALRWLDVTDIFKKKKHLICIA